MAAAKTPDITVSIDVLGGVFDEAVFASSTGVESSVTMFTFILFVWVVVEVRG